MTLTARLLLSSGALVGGAVLLCACVSTPPNESALRLSNDFGQAVREDVAAQVANPDAALKEGPPPASSGDRAALAQTRYQKGQVIQPARPETSTIGGNTSGGAGQGSSGSGMGAGATGGP